MCVPNQIWGSFDFVWNILQNLPHANSPIELYCCPIYFVFTIQENFRLVVVSDAPISDYPFKRQPHKIFKYTQTVRWLGPTNCLSMFDHFVGLAFIGLKSGGMHNVHTIFLWCAWLIFNIIEWVFEFFLHFSQKFFTNFYALKVHCV